MPSLHVSLPDGSEVTHELTEDAITLGRISENSIQIEDASVSSHHAELISRGEDYSLKDLGSTNGTRINGHAVEPEQEMQLSHGDEIIFGHIPVRYISQAGSEVQPLPQENEPVAAAAPAASTAAPSNFANASPFQTKKEKKDGAGIAVMALAVLSLLAAIGAAVLALQMPPVSL